MIDEHSLEPIRLHRELDHVFTNGAMAVRGGKRQRVCAICGYVRNNVIHHAFPRSTRSWGSGGNQKAYQGENDSWKKIFAEMLERSDLPRLGDDGSIRVEGVCTFGKRTGGGRRHSVPDQENFRYPLSKFFADTLVDGGYIADDSWFSYSFGDLGYRYMPNVWQLDLMLFPSLAPLSGHEVLEWLGDVHRLGATVDA